ncbi:MAG: tetratricopeptide repeat protein, partial [Verrucomicrobiae bacterium]|nr:tetratricopeptide repeat protein [Verrucomicrobiae bacterium]
MIDGTVKTILLFLGLVMMTMSSAKVFAQETDPLAGARQMMAEGKWAAACRELGQFAAGQKQSPQASEALYLKGECEFHLPGKQEDAVRTWESLAAVYPESEANVKGQEKMMNVWLARKNPAKAEQVREFLLRKFPAHEVTVRIYAQMGQAQFQQKKFKEAVASWEKVEANLDGASLKQLATARAVIVTEGDPSKLIEAAHEALMLENYALAEEF